MKRTIFTALVAIATFAACQKSGVLIKDNQCLTAEIEQIAQTKTYMDADNNIRWSEGDQIVAFMKSSYGHKYQLISSFAGKTYADFSIVSSGSGNLSAGTEWDHNVVYYPYSDAVEAEKSGSNYTLNVTLPSEQTYAPDSFGNGSMAMVAVSEDSNITFRNVLGGMKLQLKGTQKVVSITLIGKNGEKLSGSATVTAYTDETKPAITMASGASTYVTLNCGSGVQLNENTATEFIFALPPVLFNYGFIVVVYDSDNEHYEVEADKTNTVLRSSLLVMPEITLLPKGDYVDEYGISHGRGVKIGETVWAPVNCGYHATDYKYGKLYQWGRRYGQGYSGFLYDINGNELGEYSDATTPTIEEGGVSAVTGNHKSKENVFYIGSSEYSNHWVDSHEDKLWSSKPVKTEYDPCPAGWRVPTSEELEELCLNYSSWTIENNQPGYWFSGASSYTETVPQVFFPAAGARYNGDGYAFGRGTHGYYWSSSLHYSSPYFGTAYCLYLHNDYTVVDDSSGGRADGYSVRCVKE